MAIALDVSDVVKDFGPTRALDGLDLRAHTGEVHGFLGPNGAGKTVTIRILLGLLRPDRGRVELLGGDPWRDAVALHRRVAYVPGELELWPQLSGGEVIDVLGRLQGGIDPRRRDELVERFDLDVRRRTRTYSKGNRQKVALVAALASDAELYLFDEPTSGLDPLMEAVFQDYVRELAAEGRSVLLSSHILDQVEHLCDRVTIIRRGATVQTGTLDELRHLTRTTIRATTTRPAHGLEAIEGVHHVVSDGATITFDVDSTDLDAAVVLLGACGVTSLTSHPPTLEELFLRHYGDELSERGLAPDGTHPS
ncbi:MAG: ATP-binding cassette domain-containing protein [Microthrixaceae bacterium]